MMVSSRRLKEAGAINILLGFGPGSMITSPHLNRENAVFERFGIRGAMPGLVICVLQTGVLGVCFLTYFLVSLLRKAYARYRQIDDTRFKMVALGFMGATFVFLVDFFIYSESSLNLGVLTPVYFYVASIVLYGCPERLRPNDNGLCTDRFLRGYPKEETAAGL
jgi:O-antigen ligase